MPSVFSIDTKNGDGFVMARHQTGRVALLFSTRDKAWEFVLNKSLEIKYRPRELTASNVRDWLANVRSEGVTAFCLDPSPDQHLSTVDLVPKSLDTVLCHLETPPGMGG